MTLSETSRNISEGRLPSTGTITTSTMSDSTLRHVVGGLCQYYLGLGKVSVGDSKNLKNPMVKKIDTLVTYRFFMYFQVSTHRLFPGPDNTLRDLQRPPTTCLRVACCLQPLIRPVL